MDGRDPNEGARGGLTLSTARVPLSGTNTKKKRWSRAARALCQLRCFLVGQASLVKKAGGWSCWTAAAGVVWEGGEESSRGRSARALAAAGRFCVGGRRPSREPLGGGGWKSGSLCFFVSFTQTVSFSHVLRIGQTPATPASAPRPTPAWCAPAAAASTSAAAPPSRTAAAAGGAASTPTRSLSSAHPPPPPATTATQTCAWRPQWLLTLQPLTPTPTQRQDHHHHHPSPPQPQPHPSARRRRATRASPSVPHATPQAGAPGAQHLATPLQARALPPRGGTRALAPFGARRRGG